ncbi:LON peptidase substrate-binding domain-containing protein [Oceanicaulis sp. LC35]|uniref:LON peptidase substrate-binding domain-containing protein n=1 Tax=Oceanicaulis sp. LC35 TaxID=3349635 RepID=UPI003F86DFF3
MSESLILPSEIKLFPIRGCILPPGEHLPLNVFEPRYLNMVDDALASDRIIGVIQPAPGGTPDKPALHGVGGAGRIVSHQETSDGRYLMVLEGLTRFALEAELDRQTPYRVARVDYRPFTQDLVEVHMPPAIEVTGLIERLRAYFDLVGIETDWPALEKAPLSLVINKTAMAAPFDPNDKQSLLEAVSIPHRAEILDRLMQDSLDEAASGSQGWTP